MAPPTRHSSRVAIPSHREDENAGVNTLDRPVSRALRGKKEPTVTSKAEPTKATATANPKTGLSTANIRKRILDDRTNNVKPTTTSGAASLKPTMPRKELPVRKASASTTIKKTISVLEEADEVVSSKASKQPVKREVKARPTALRRTTSTATKTAEVPEKTGSSSKLPASSKTHGSNRQATGAVKARRRVDPPASQHSQSAATNAAEDTYDTGRVVKKPRTSEPDEPEKENVEPMPTSRAAKVDDLAKRKKKNQRALPIELPRVTRPKCETVLKEGEEGWQDLDEGDEDDPLMVKEYVNEIYYYMRELELETLPDANYMSRQNELTWKMRGVLVDWMIEVHSKFRLLPETLYLAINLMDRFLTKRTVALIKFQLVGVTALFLAAKYEEVICPSVTNFLYMTDGGYDCEEILKAETYMLEMLDWDLRYPNPLNFLRRVSKADQYDIQSRTFAKYFMEISVVDHRLVATPPSLLAATSIWLARKLLNRGYWNANLVHYSGYTEREILPSAQTMLDYILRSGCKTLGMGLEPTFVGAVGYEGNNEHGNLFKKYATRKFFRVSELVRDWAVNQYTFETPTGWEWDKLEEWTEPSQDRVAEEEDEHDEDEQTEY